jgi:hypothetical protein
MGPMNGNRILLFFLAAFAVLDAHASETTRSVMARNSAPTNVAPGICILTLRIEQVHWTLNPITWIQDSANASKLEIPTLPSYCSQLRVGQLLSNEFRWGSYLLRGSTGNMQVWVEKISLPTGQGATKR